VSDRLLELEAFIRVAETENFSQAARDLGLTQSAVSRIVASLEKRLCTSLLARTTRCVTLTQAGARYAEHAKAAIFALEEGHSQLQSSNGLHGQLHVALPVTFGSRVVIPMLGAFLDEYPHLQLQLSMSDQFQDLVRDGVDVALRVGQPVDSKFTARKLASATRLLVASPRFLDTYGAPSSPADLLQYACITGPSEVAPPVWTFRAACGAITSVKVKGRVHATSAEGVTACAVSGFGIASVSTWAASAELNDGRLLACCTDYQLPPAEAYAVFPAARRAPAKARIFVDFIGRQLAG
jgi:DNA-binding transcriptional LysR family regulator